MESIIILNVGDSAQIRPIQIQIFADKLIISNDSVFPEDWTMEDFLRKHRSRPYNPLIANTFYRAGFIESWGRGIMKIREACIKAGNPEPIYHIKKDELTVVFKINSESANETGESANKIGESANGTDEYENMIVEYLKNNERITSKSAMELLKLGSSRAREILSKMAEKDIIIKNGKTNGTFYTLR